MRSVNVENSPTFTLVVAGAIGDEAGRLLLQRVPPGKRHAGLWEFPGGKVEPEENPVFALCREVREELALDLDPASLRPAGFAEDMPPGGDRAIVLLLYTCARWRGVPRPLDGQQWGWFAPEAAAALPMPAMDKALFGELSVRARIGAGGER